VQPQVLQQRVAPFEGGIPATEPSPPFAAQALVEQQSATVVAGQPQLVAVAAVKAAAALARQAMVAQAAQSQVPSAPALQLLVLLA
jgi:hypothetical protein